MKIFAALLVPPLAFVLSAVTPANSESPPEWAYPKPSPGLKVAPDDGVPRRVPGSNVTYTLTQLRDRFVSPIWHADEIPPQPEVVARGRKPDVYACGFCHRADGPGGPENANLTGLPAAYIVQQMADFKSGARRSLVADRPPAILKATIAKAITDAEVEAAAAYFSSVKARSNVSVVEAHEVPRTYFTLASYLAVLKGDEKEAIAGRIIEVPENTEQFGNRDTRARFIAHVPPGSIKKGQSLATTGGGGRTVQCSTCHGPDLKGLGPIPGFAGRSPTYIVRQLYDFKHGARAGIGSALMRESVEKLTLEDMIALAAYAGSLAP
jgi:cytochrome c553